MADVTHTLRLPFDAGEPFRITGSAEDNGVMRAIEADGLYEVDVVWMLCRLVRPDWVVLDIGANVGAIALAIGRFVPNGCVHAFEPEPHNARYLAGNIAANKMDNVIAHELALSDEGGELSMSSRADFPSGAHLSQRVEEGEQSLVHVVRLDDWAKELTRLDLVKIDVEGHELEVLRGATATLRRFRPDLIVEFNPVTHRRFGTGSIDELYDALVRSYRWRFWIRPDGGISWLSSRRHLDLVLTHKGYVDLYLTHRPPVRVLRRGLARAIVGGLRAGYRLARSQRRPPVPSDVQFAVAPAYRLELEPRTLHLAAGARASLAGSLRNDMKIWMSSTYVRHPFTIRHRWLEAAGGMISESTVPFTFDPLAPGASIRVAIDVDAPTVPGDYRLVVSVVQEGFAWLYELDESLGCTIPVRVDAG